MTHSIDAPLPPPATAGTGSPSTSPSTTQKAQDTKDVALGEAKNVGQTAAQAGSHVASTATDQAKQVANETQRQAKDLLEQGRSQVRQQAVSQQHKAAEGLTGLAQQLRGMADGSGQGAPGPAADLLQQVSGYVEQFADKLQNREPAELLDEVRRFARRKPGMFLLGAAAAGIVAGRLTSGAKAAHSDSAPSGTGGTARTGSYGYVDPTPTYAEDAYPGTATTTTTSFGAPGTATGGAPLPPPPYGTVPPAGGAVPPTTPAGWDDPARRPGGVG